MNKHKNSVRTLAMAAAIGFAAATSSPIAFAQDTATATAPVITQKTGDLTIHKLADPGPDLGERTGNEADGENAPGTKQEGVVFSITPINLLDANKKTITPGTNEWLAAAQGLDAKTLQSWIKDKKASMGTTLELKATDAEGKTTAANIAIGAYFVHEVTPAKGYTPAADFIAFVPMTQSNAATGGTVWNYDVHAFPKNYKQTKPVKTVKDVDKNVSENIVYNIDTTIRQIEEGKQLSYYYVKDVINKDRLDVASATVTVKIGETKLAEGTDYTLTKDAATGEILVRFLDAGLNQLKSGTKVTTTIEAQFNKLAAGDADQPFLTLENTASDIFPNNPSSDLDVNDKPDTPDTPPTDTPKNPSNKVKTYYGSVNFTKVGQDETGAKKTLAGAEFKIFRVKPVLTENKVDLTKSCDALTADTIKGDGVTGWQNKVSTNLFKSGKDGTVSIDGLHVTDFANNVEVVENARPVYCLVETKSPSGYELLAKPMPFVFNATATVGDNPETPEVEEPSRTYEPAKITQTGKVVNLKDTTPNLPMTGGMGIGLLVGLGAAVVGAGMFFARRSAKN